MRRLLQQHRGIFDAAEHREADDALRSDFPTRAPERNEGTRKVAAVDR